MQIPTDMTTAITVFVCPRCGTIGKSGKMSCCGRGGSWFNNCGGAGNIKLHHMWSEGIQACTARTQSKTVIGQRLGVAQQRGIYPSKGVGMTKYKAVIALTKTPTFTQGNTSTPSPDTLLIVKSTSLADNVSTRTSASTSMTTRGYVNLLRMNAHANPLLIIVGTFFSLLVTVI